jgi:sortase A
MDGPPSPSATAHVPLPSTSGTVASERRPQLAFISMPAIGVHELRVVPYRGRTDDARGNRIQDRGVAASPYGPDGGTGPGGIGNYQVTAHRNTAGGPLYALPALNDGDTVEVTTTRTTFVYRVIGTRMTSFRSARSLAEQRAPVPGRPGAPARRAMITISTCATQEDHAAGNYWSDRFGNPEHRIDKIGVLIRTTDSSTADVRRP